MRSWLDLTAAQRGDWQMKIDDARCKLKTVSLGRGEKFLPGFQADLVKKVLAAVEK